MLLTILVVAGLAVSPAAAQAINVTGDFGGTLVGYDTEQGQQSHVINVEGGLTVDGEDAQNVRITISSGNRMILNQSSVDPFVEGERDISFDRRNDERRVILTTDEVPSGTTIRIDFDVVYVGGSDEDELNAGTVNIEYETAGGTEGEDSFTAQTDMSTSADNRIGALQSEVDALGNWRLIGIGGGIFGVLMLLVAIVLYLRCCREDKPPV